MVPTRPAAGIDRVAAYLDAGFHGALPLEMIHQVVRTAQRDLEGEVPPEALAEFPHRLAWERLIDLQQGPGTGRRPYRADDADQELN